MDIILVTSTSDSLVHGTDNGKKTGCGINLTKPENVSRYRRGDIMTDLKELTCEKCKTVIAKKMIKADKKEMSKLLKEEKLRAKNGFDDDGIVPLGNTTAKITKSPQQIAEEKEKAARDRDAAARKRAEEEKMAAEKEAAQARLAAERAEQARLEEERLAQQPAKIAGTDIAMDPSLAQFAINVPQEKKEEEAPVNNAQDDFLAQFAIQKPAEEQEEPATEAAAPQNDFLAQFAVPSAPQQPEPQPAPVPEAPKAMETVSEPVPQEDITKLFSINNSPQPDEYIPPVEPSQPEEIIQEPEPQQAADTAPSAEWDTVANQLFGYTADPSAQPEEMAELKAPETDNIAPASASRNFEPELDDIAVPQVDNLQPAYRESAPVLDDIFAVEQHENTDFYGSRETSEEIVQQPEEEIPEVPQFNAQSEAIPEVPQFNAQPETIPEVPQFNAQPETIPEVPQLNAQPETIPEVPQFNAQPETIPEVPQFNAQSEEIPEVPQLNAQPEMPEMPKMPEPENKTPETVDNGDADDMNKYRYSTPIFADEVQKPAKQTAPQVSQAQPQIINIPQFAGYDMNGQPVYTYVQMQITGYEKNGQPILAPIGNQQGIMPAPVAPQPAPQAAAPVAPQPAPQAAAPVAPQPAPQAAAPVAPQPVPQAAAPVAPQPAPQAAAPRQNPGTPTANVSKIAVHSHSKPMPKSFVDALSISRETGSKNLIETQGLKANMPVLTSVEDVLTTMNGGSVSAKKKVVNNDPVFQEYKTPDKKAAARPAARPKVEEKQTQFMTKAELKAKKKQDKIDAKFRKEMAKRGL